MPRFDGTGPKGEGPKTGRNQGNCADETKQNFYGYGCGAQRRCLGNTNNNPNNFNRPNLNSQNNPNGPKQQIRRNNTN